MLGTISPMTTPHDYGNHRKADAPTEVPRFLGRSDGVWPPDRKATERISRAVLKQRERINARAYEAAKARREAES